MSNTDQIGVIDSGVGGLTLVRELRELCPGEDIVYFGDSANCPYGNRARENIFALSMNILRFMRDKGVKAVAVACNTISAMVDDLAAQSEMPLFGIISPVARAVAQSGLSRVGVFATEFTISTGVYNRQIQAGNPNITVYGKSSFDLADQVERGEDDAVIEAGIREKLGELLANENLSHIIMGCSHFPLVEESFRRCFPGVTFINPAREQAREIYSFLGERGLINPGRDGRFSVYTSGNTQSCLNIITRLKIQEPSVIESVTL